MELCHLFSEGSEQEALHGHSPALLVGQFCFFLDFILETSIMFSTLAVATGVPEPPQLTGLLGASTFMWHRGLPSGAAVTRALREEGAS